MNRTIKVLVLILFTSSFAEEESLLNSFIDNTGITISSYEDNYFAWMIDPSERDRVYINDNGVTPSEDLDQSFPAFQLSVKLPLGILEIANSPVYIFYTGLFHFQTNRKSGPVISHKNHVGVFRRTNINLERITFVDFGFAHESDGQVIEDSLTFANTKYAYDHLDMGWNYMFIEVPISITPAKGYYNLHFQTQVELRFNLFKKNKMNNQDTTKNWTWLKEFEDNIEDYRGTGISTMLSYIFDRESSIQLKYELQTGDIFGQAKAWPFRYGQHRIQLFYNNSMFPIYIASNLGRSRSISKYWTRGENQFEIGIMSSSAVFIK